MRRKLAGGAAALLAVALSGCGGSTVGQALDPVARAATATSHTPGYRMRVQMSVSTPQTTVHITMSGSVDTVRHAGTVVEQLALGGHSVRLRALFSGQTFYMRLPRLPGEQAALSQMTGGKAWVRFDLSGILGGMSLGSMPTGANPAQFLDYLRAASSHALRLGGATIAGVPTNHYRVRVSLDRYARLAAPAGRASVRRGIALLESQTGSHTLPMDVWVDSAGIVRQFSFSLTTCAAGQRARMSMTAQLFDFARQAAPALPPAAQSYDLTPMIQSEMSHLRTGCARSA